MTEAKDPWRSLADTAEQLGVSTRTVRDHIKAGRLPASRIQGSHFIRIRQSAIDALLVPIKTVRDA